MKRRNYFKLQQDWANSKTGNSDALKATPEIEPEAPRVEKEGRLALSDVRTGSRYMSLFGRMGARTPRLERRAAKTALMLAEARLAELEHPERPLASVQSAKIFKGKIKLYPRRVATPDGVFPLSRSTRATLGTGANTSTVGGSLLVTPLPIAIHGASSKHDLFLLIEDPEAGWSSVTKLETGNSLAGNTGRMNQEAHEFVQRLNATASRMPPDNELSAEIERATEGVAVAKARVLGLNTNEN